MKKMLRAANRKYLLRYRTEYLVFLVLMIAMRSMSPELVWRMARQMGRLCFHFGLRRKNMIANLEIAFPDMTDEERVDTARRCWEHFACMLVDTVFQRRMLRRSNLLEKIKITGWAKKFIDEHGADALPERIRGCIFCGGHFGNWELATGMFKLLGVSIAPVYRTPSNPFLAKLIREIRLDQHAKFIERRGAVAMMVDIIEGGGNVGILFDQEAMSGLMVPLFGVAAPTHKTPAVLHRDLKAPIFFGSMIRRGDFLQYEARGALLEDLTVGKDRVEDLRAVLTALNGRLEERIREHPEQYFWMHRRWKYLGVHGEKYKKDRK